MALAGQVEEIEDSVLQAIRQRALRTDGPFKLASGKMSPYFLDMKTVLTDGSPVLAQVAELMLRRIPREATAVGGLAMGCIPISTEIVALNNRMNAERPLHFFWVRPEEKSHGLGGRISGTLLPTDQVVIVDDVTTQGKSVLHAIGAVQERDAGILKIITVVDRGEGASEAFKDRGFIFEPLFTRKDVLGQ